MRIAFMETNEHYKSLPFIASHNWTMNTEITCHIGNGVSGRERLSDFAFVIPPNHESEAQRNGFTQEKKW